MAVVLQLSSCTSRMGLMFLSWSPFPDFDPLKPGMLETLVVWQYIPPSLGSLDPLVLPVLGCLCSMHYLVCSTSGPSPSYDSAGHVNDSWTSGTVYHPAVLLVVIQTQLMTTTNLMCMTACHHNFNDSWLCFGD